eukprot:8282966-Lingulodinium_polyedra.AAC.1
MRAIRAPYSRRVVRPAPRVSASRASLTVRVRFRSRYSISRRGIWRKTDPSVKQHVAVELI